MGTPTKPNAPGMSANATESSPPVSPCTTGSTTTASTSGVTSTDSPTASHEVVPTTKTPAVVPTVLPARTSTTANSESATEGLTPLSIQASLVVTTSSTTTILKKSAAIMPVISLSLEPVSALVLAAPLLLPMPK